MSFQQVREISILRLWCKIQIRVVTSTKLLTILRLQLVLKWIVVGTQAQIPLWTICIRNYQRFVLWYSLWKHDNVGIRDCKISNKCVSDANDLPNQFYKLWGLLQILSVEYLIHSQYQGKVETSNTPSGEGACYQFMEVAARSERYLSCLVLEKRDCLRPAIELNFKYSIE